MRKGDIVMVEEKNEHQFSEDTGVEIQISKDSLTAYLLYNPSSNVKAITEEQFNTFLQQQGVHYGLHHEHISLFIQDPSLYIGKKFLIAEGKEMIQGQDSSIEMLYQQQNNKRPKENEDGSVDFYSITEISNVEKGQILAKKIPSSEGIDGITVTNEVIKAKDGRDFKIKAGKNVVVDEASQAVYSLISGQVSVTEDEKINVFPIYEVNGDLDFEIGNIDFVGNVIIRGSVLSGFKVKANGDIRITGGVEGAELEADGSIHIQSGITAQHKGYVQAGKDVNLSFVVNGRVHAQGNVNVSQSIMHSEIIAGENIECGGAKGLIVGGTLQAGKSLKCRTIGNSMTTSTTIEVGSNPKLANRKRAIQLELKELMSTLAKTEQALQVLDQLTRQLGQLSPDKKELQIKLTNTKIQLDKKIKELKLENIEIEQELEDETNSAVEVAGIIYPGTRLVFGKYIKYIKDNQQRIKYYIEDSEIVGRPLI
jgi:uncharacterized protein (DUF342 family)